MDEIQSISAARYQVSFQGSMGTGTDVAIKTAGITMVKSDLQGIPYPYPVFGWLLSPMPAAGAMSLSSVSVIGNAHRLKSARI